MKKIFLMFILTFTFLHSEIIKNLNELKLSNNNTPFCVSSYKLNKTNSKFMRYSYQKPTEPPTQITLNESQIGSFIIGGYEWDTIKATCTLSPIAPPTDGTGGTGGTGGTITITPDENGLIMGLSPQNFHFSFALWGVALSFLMAIGLILSF